MMTKITGVLPALITPLNEDESLNVSVLRSLIQRLLTEGADGFYIGGATGEGIALRREVREQLAEKTIQCVGGKKPCIVHVASASMDEALELARHAQKIGADMISAIPPLFFSYDEDDVYEYYKKLAGSVQIPMMVYYSPAANFPITPEFAARLFEIENVTAIKWTSSDYYGMIRLKHLTQGDMNIVNGCDEMLLQGLSAGADGGIGTNYNIMLPRFRAIYDAFMAGDMEKAKRIQTETDECIAILLQYKIIPAIKGVLECMGEEVGNAAFPMKRYTKAEKQKLFARLKDVGMEA